MVHPDPDQLGTLWRADPGLVADPRRVVAALADLPAPTTRWSDWRARLRASYDDWQTPRPTPGALRLEQVVGWLAQNLPANAIVTNGAGNYASFLHRYYRWRCHGTQLAPTSGSMGYGLPAAIAASLTHPDRTVVCLAGDGCLQMTVNELSTAAQYGATPIVIVANNGRYGTIRMHQERHYPGRVSGTDLFNPDLPTWSAPMAAMASWSSGTRISPPPLNAPACLGRLSVIELRLDPEALTPARPSPRRATRRSGRGHDPRPAQPDHRRGRAARGPCPGRRPAVRCHRADRRCALCGQCPRDGRRARDAGNRPAGARQAGGGVDALVLAGGSAFGLAACDGVMAALHRAGRGFAVGPARVPIVPGAIVFDLLNGGDKGWDANPYPALGAAAWTAAGGGLRDGIGGRGHRCADRHAEGRGRVGIRGAAGWGHRRRAGRGERAWAGDRGRQPPLLGSPVGAGGRIRRPGLPPRFPAAHEPAPAKHLGEATTIAIVATDAALDKAGLQRMATAAHDGLARALVPSHTPLDGDLVFAVSTGARPWRTPSAMRSSWAMRRPACWRVPWRMACTAPRRGRVTCNPAGNSGSDRKRAARPAHRPREIAKRDSLAIAGRTPNPAPGCDARFTFPSSSAPTGPAAALTLPRRTCSHAATEMHPEDAMTKPTDLKSLLRDPSLLETRAFVGGEWVDADDGATFEVTNPARGDVIAHVADLGRAETARAIDAAAAAMKDWAARTAKDRAQVMRKWFDLMMANQDDLGTILTAEQGKPLAEAKGEIAYGASFIEWFGEEAKRVYGETIPGHQADKRISVIRQPSGRRLDHALELSERDDRAQGRARAGRRLRLRRAARSRDAPVGAGHGSAGRTGGPAQGHPVGRPVVARQRHRQGVLREPPGP